MATEQPIFNEETTQSLIELGEVLRRIHNRLISEDWIIKDGVFTPPSGYQPSRKPRQLKRKDSQ